MVKRAGVAAKLRIMVHAHMRRHPCGFKLAALQHCFHPSCGIDSELLRIDSLLRGDSGFTEEFVAHCNSSIQANPPRSCGRSTSATTMVEVNDTDVPFATTRSGGMTLRWMSTQ